MHTQNVDGQRYFLTMFTAQQQYVRVEVLRSKDHVTECVFGFNHWLYLVLKYSARRKHADNV